VNRFINHLKQKREWPNSRENRALTQSYKHYMMLYKNGRLTDGALHYFKILLDDPLYNELVIGQVDRPRRTRVGLRTGPRQYTDPPSISADASADIPAYNGEAAPDIAHDMAPDISHDMADDSEPYDVSVFLLPDIQ
jgi:hypothetical protein